MYPQSQPAKGVLAVRRITNRRAAEALGVSEHYVGRVLLGQADPSREFRRAMAAYLDLPEDELFRPMHDRTERGTSRVRFPAPA